MKKALHYRIWKDSHLKGFLETRIKSWGTNVFAYVLAASLQKPNFRYCCLTNVQHWRLVFQAHLWAFTAAFQTLIFVRSFSLWKKKKICLGSQRFSNSKHRPMSPQTWTDGVHRAATSCDSLRGDELALGDIPQLSSVMDQHKVPRFSYMEAIAWTLSHWFASVGEAGFDVGRVRVGTLRISAVTRLGHTEWLPLSAGKKTHILITTGSLVMALFECIPTCEWGSETGRREVRNISLRGLLAGRQSEWASCRSTITNRPAAWEGLPNIIHMCHILSEPPPGLAVHSRREGGVLVRAHFTQARGQLGSTLAVKWPLRRGRL